MMKNFFRNLHPKVQFFLSLCFMAFLVAVLIWFALFSLLDRVRGESAEIEAAKIRRASIEARRSEAKREEVVLAGLKNDVGRVEGVFVEHPLSFFEFLEDMASQSGLSISLALEGQVSGAGNPERLRVSVDGAYRNLLRFMRGLESAPYAIEIRAIDVQMVNQRSLFSDSSARLVIDLQIISK